MIEEMKRKCIEIETLTIGLCNEESIVKRRTIKDEIIQIVRELQPKEKPQEPEKEPPEEEGDNRDEWFDNNKCVDCIFEDFGYCDAVISVEEHSHQFDTGQCSHYKTVTHCKPDVCPTPKPKDIEKSQEPEDIRPTCACGDELKLIISPDGEWGLHCQGCDKFHGTGVREKSQEPEKVVHYMSVHNYLGRDENDEFLPKSIFSHTACGKLVGKVCNASPEALGQPKADCPECLANKEQFDRDCRHISDKTVKKYIEEQKGQ